MSPERRTPTPEELERFFREQEDDRLEGLMEPMLDRLLCGKWGIRYDPEGGTHKAPLDAIYVAIRAMIDTHNRSSRLLGGVGRAAGSGAQSLGKKAWDALMGALVLVGLGWLATKLGFKLPGVPG